MLFFGLVFISGKVAFYFNISKLLGENGTITKATYTESTVIRTVAVALKFRVITVVAYNNKSAEKVNITLTGTDSKSNSFQVMSNRHLTEQFWPIALYQHDNG